MDGISVVICPELCRGEDKRFVVINAHTGNIIDDARGYGYKSASSAYKGFSYKQNGYKKVSGKRKNNPHVADWAAENKKFIRAMDRMALLTLKGQLGPEAKFDGRTVENMLAAWGLKTEFSGSDLFEYWRNLS